MGFMPEKLSTRDKTLLGVAAIAVIAGGAGYYFMSEAPVAEETPAATAQAPQAATDPKTKDKKPLAVEENVPTPPTGGPRANPDYKGDGK